MDENCLLAAGKSNIRFARQFAPMKSKAVAQAVCHLTHPYLRLCVLTADGAHVRALIFATWGAAYSEAEVAIFLTES